MAELSIFIGSMRGRYWDLRHFLWDVREWLFVKEAMRHLKSNDDVYIHPRTGGRPKAILRRYEFHMESIGREPVHAHVEGRRRG